MEYTMFPPTHPSRASSLTSKRHRSPSIEPSPSPTTREPTQTTVNRMKAHLKNNADFFIKTRSAEKWLEHDRDGLSCSRSKSPDPEEGEELAVYEARYADWYKLNISRLANRRVSEKTQEKYSDIHSPERGRSLYSRSSVPDSPVFSYTGAEDTPPINPPQRNESTSDSRSLSKTRLAAIEQALEETYKPAFMKTDAWIQVIRGTANSILATRYVTGVPEDKKVRSADVQQVINEQESAHRENTVSESSQTIATDAEDKTKQEKTAFEALFDITTKKLGPNSTGKERNKLALSLRRDYGITLMGGLDNKKFKAIKPVDGEKPNETIRKAAVEWLKEQPASILEKYDELKRKK